MTDEELRKLLASNPDIAIAGAPGRLDSTQSAKVDYQYTKAQGSRLELMARGFAPVKHPGGSAAAAHDEFFNFTEEDEQMMLIEWVSDMSSDFPQLKWIFHVPNGGHRYPAVAKKMKDMGQSPGVPDLLFPFVAHEYCGLAIEMKRKRGGVVSDKQKAWMSWLDSQGWLCSVCYGHEQAIEMISAYLSIDFHGD